MKSEQAPSRAGLYLGLISGTSMDGVDAVLVELGPGRLHTLAALTHPYPPALKRRLQAVIVPEARLSLHEFATLDVEVGNCFAEAAAAVLGTPGIGPASLVAIGSHGQTLRHAPREVAPYSLQIGNPAVIAARLGTATVADFRAMDIAYGGEGAPLVPPFHAWALGSTDENRVIVNIGGIANISLLPAAADTAAGGYDTGPGNCLMDVWSAHQRGLPYDAEGGWAASGRPSAELLAALLEDDYYRAAAPKSTGREVFNLAYLESYLARFEPDRHAPADVQATLAALTVETIAHEIERLKPGWPAGLYVCGGGAHNRHVMESLASRLAPLPVTATAALGLDPDMVEATAFAWLAAMRVSGQPVRMTTGARVAAIHLGAIYLPTQ